MRTGGGARRGLVSLAVLAAAVAIPALSGAAAERGVTIVDDAYDPRRVTVTAGDTVVWQWAKGNANPHTVTAVDGSFDSDAECPADDPSACRAPGHMFSVTFSDTGTYAYHCRVHPVTMVATVEVVAASEPPAGDDPTSAPPSAAPSEGGPSSPSPSATPAGQEPSPTPDGAPPERRRAGPPGFTVGSVPSPAPSGERDDPVVAPPSSFAPLPTSPAVGPTATASGRQATADAADGSRDPLRRTAILVAAVLVLLSGAAWARVVVFGRRW